LATAKNGDTVHVHYTGRLEDGSVFDSSEGSDPLEFTLGEGRVIPGFEKAVEGLEVGEDTSATIPPEEAYGPRSDDLVMDISREQLPEGMSPEVGQRLEMKTQEGQTVPVTVTGTSDDKVQLDANHPLAGEELTFDVLLVEIDA